MTEESITSLDPSVQGVTFQNSSSVAPLQLFKAVKTNGNKYGIYLGKNTDGELKKDEAIL